MGDKPAASQRKKKVKIPQVLVYEVLEDQPIYYKGYRDVLDKTKTLEDIMGCSSLQFALIDYFQRILYTAFPAFRYWIASNEAGLHIGLRDNLSTDIALYDKKVLSADKISNRYADVSPLLVIEIDVNAETDPEAGSIAMQDYVHLKIRKLLDFGVQRVIWVFTGSRTVIVAEPGKDWLTKDWGQTIELWEGEMFNVAQYLEQEGIEVA